MRPPCPYCARKHLAQALVLLQEARQGYPEHRWIAIGHLAEASDELIAAINHDMVAIAHEIRDHRKELEISDLYEVPILSLIQRIGEVHDKARSEGLESAVSPTRLRLAPVPHRELLWEGVVGMAALGVDLSKVRLKPNQQFVHETRGEKLSIWIEALPSTKDMPVPDGPLVPNMAIGMNALGTPPCAPCEEAKRKRTEAIIAAEKGLFAKTVEHRASNERPSLLLMTTLGDFAPSYSLTTVILDQAHAAALAGFDVDILVMENADLSKMPPLPPQIIVHRKVPVFEWKEDVVSQAALDVLPGLLDTWLREHKPSVVITHDLVFQSWFVTFAAALHRAEELFGISHLCSIYHMAHSAPGIGHGAPARNSPQWYRRTLPPGHRLLVCNQELAPAFSRYYACSIESVYSLTNARDVRAFLNMPPLASEIITRTRMHLADIVQVYPFSLPRWKEKGVAQLLEAFGAIANAPETQPPWDVHLVLAVCHANGADAKGHLDAIEALREKHGLRGKVTITCQVWPQTASQGLSSDVIRSLFAVSNLFMFPTWSEAASLILREAALSGCLLVLNDNVSQLKGCIRPEEAIWASWDALGIRGKMGPEDVRGLAATIIDRLLVKDTSSMMRRAAMVRFSLESMGLGIRNLAGLPGLAEGSEPSIPRGPVGLFGEAPEAS